MVLLGDKAQLEAQLEGRFALFADSANLDARLVHGLRRTYQRLRNHIGHTRWNSLVTWAMWILVRSVWRGC